MEKFRNKRICLIILVFYLIMITGCTMKDDSIRLRILANSDSEVDQLEKEYVKNIVKSIYEKDPLIDFNRLKDKLYEQIKNDRNISHMISIEYKTETFPAKSYNGKFYPSGNYQTILITIGEGRGKNFWTLLYPDFFNINFDDDNEIEYHSYIYDKLIG